MELVPGDMESPRGVVTHVQVTDAHLVALARHHGVRLATFDRGLPAFAGSDAAALVPFE